MKISKNWLLVAVVTSALAFIGTRVLADDAADIQAYGNNAVATFDGNGDFLYGGNNADATVDTIMSQPGVYGGHTYTGWSVLVGDASGSLDVFTSSSSAAAAGWTPAEGQTVSLTATYSPYHSIPEIATVTAVTVSGVGEPLWNSPGVQGSGSQVVTIPPVLANPFNSGSPYLPLAQNLAAYMVEIKNVTISGQGALTTFPATNEAMYLNDSSGNQLTMYFWYTSYSCDGMMVGAPIPGNNPKAPYGPIDVYGMLTSYPSVSAGITNWQDELLPTAFVQEIPEPSSFMLAGVGLLSLLAVIRRRHS